MRRSSSAGVVLLALIRPGAGLQILAGKRFNLRKLTMSAQAPRVAVIGGGISGLACGKALTAQGIDVVVYDTGKLKPFLHTQFNVAPIAHDATC